MSTRWQINLSTENKLLKQHNLGQFGCSSLVQKFDRNGPTFLINYPVPTKVWEIPQTLCVVGMTTYYGINFKNSKSVKIFQDMHWCEVPTGCMKRLRDSLFNSSDLMKRNFKTKIALFTSFLKNNLNLRKNSKRWKNLTCPFFLTKSRKSKQKIFLAGQVKEYGKLKENN